MAWTSPMTFVSGATLTAAQLNTHLRDNLNETAPAKATGANQIFVSTGANQIAARTPNEATVSAAEATSSTTFTTLNTPGPNLTITTGTKAILIITCTIQVAIAGNFGLMSWQCSGATTIAADDNNGIAHTSSHIDAPHQSSSVQIINLTAGSNTFSARYRGSGASASFLRRRLTVVPL